MISLLKLEFLRMFRNKKHLILTVGMPIIFFLVFSSAIHLDTKEAQQAFINDYLMSMTTFSLTSFAFFNFPFDMLSDKTTGFDETLQKVPLTKFQVTLVKIIKLTLQASVAIILTFMTGHYFKGVNFTMKQWLFSGLLLLIGLVIFLSISTLFTLFDNIQSASVFANIVFLLSAVLGGLWFPLSQFPKWFQVIGEHSPAYYFKNLATSYLKNGEIPWHSICFLLLYGFFFLALYAVILRRKTIFKKFIH